MRIVVVGTGTEIGKTHVVACLLFAARQAHRRIGAYKPIATGFDDLCEDAAQHAAALSAPYVAPTYGFRRPISPHLAAREENRPIDLRVIADRANELSAGVDVLVVESAGGLFSPLGPNITNVELVETQKPDAWVLVAPDRLGVLHELSAVMTAAAARGLSAPVIALSAPAQADSSTGTNAAEIATLGIARVAAEFPRAPWSAVESQHAANALWAEIGKRATS